MDEWINTFDERLWLKADETGEADAQLIVQVLGLKQGDRVLDLPCGAGRISIPLARLGCRVTGIDLTPNHIERAKKRQSEEHLEAEFLVGDMRQIGYNGEFDAIINWGGSFGYFSDEENARVVARMARALRPGGRLLIDQPNREQRLRHFRSCSLGETLTQYWHWDAVSQRMEARWIIHDPDGDKESFSTLRVYTPAQFRRLFAGAGLSWELPYSNDGTLFTRSSWRILAIARKR